MVGGIVTAGFACGCGCGSPTGFTRVAGEVAQGKTSTDIATTLGVSTAYVRGVLRNPPKYAKGHQHRNNAGRILAMRAERLATQVPAMFARAEAAPRSAYPQTRANATKYKAQAWAAALHSVHTSWWAAATPLRPSPDLGPLRVVTLRELERIRARLRESEWETIAALRDKVGMGWRQDAEWDPQLVSIEGMADRWREGKADYFDFMSAHEEQQHLEREHVAARQVMDLPYFRSMVGIALGSPQNLTENEKWVLRTYFVKALQGQHLPLQHHEHGDEWEGYKPQPQPSAMPAPGGPVGGGGLKRGRGHGRHGAASHAVGQKRFENREQIVLEREMRKAMRELRRAS